MCRLKLPISHVSCRHICSHAMLCICNRNTSTTSAWHTHNTALGTELQALQSAKAVAGYGADASRLHAGGDWAEGCCACWLSQCCCCCTVKRGWRWAMSGRVR